MDDKKLSIARVFFTDYITSLSAIALVITAGFFVYDRFIMPTALTQEMPFILAFIGVIGMAAIVWRIRLISSAFEYGWEVEGDIVEVSFFRDRGRVAYIYTIQGERYQSSNAVMQHRLTKALHRGQKVIIMVNKDNPKIAFIRDIYI